MKKFKFSEQLAGERIYLLKHSLDLAQIMFDYVEKDRMRLDRFFPWVKHTKIVGDSKNYIQSTHKCWEKMTSFDYGIYKKDNDTYMGNIGIHLLIWNYDWCEVGYWILRDFEGLGYISESIKILEKYLFQEGFNKIFIKCSGQNERSIRVLQNCNYFCEGTARQDVIERGEYCDTKCFSKLSSEFIKEEKNIFIRRARGLDALNIIKSHVKSIREICSKDYSEKQIMVWSGRDFKEEKWQKLINTDHVWVLDNGEDVLGFGHMNFSKDNSAEIEGLYFSSMAIGKGLGRRLIDIMKQFALSKGKKNFILSSTITAKGFYEKIGFHSIGEMRNIIIGGEKIGCYPMRLTL